MNVVAVRIKRTFVERSIASLCLPTNMGMGERWQTVQMGPQSSGVGGKVEDEGRCAKKAKEEQKG